MNFYCAIIQISAVEKYCHPKQLMFSIQVLGDNIFKNSQTY